MSATPKVAVIKPRKAKIKVKAKGKALDTFIKQEKKDRVAQLRVEKAYSTIGIQRYEVPFGGEEVIIVVTHPDTRNWLREYTAIDSTYTNVPKLKPAQLINFVEQINEAAGDPYMAYMKDLAHFLNYELGDSIYKAKELRKTNQITFDMLWCLFQKGQDCYTTFENEITAGTIESVDYEKTFFGSYFSIRVKQIDTDGQGFKEVQTKFSIYGFRGVIPIDQLAVKPLTEDVKKELVKRGKKFQKYGIGANYVQYTGNLMIRDWMKNILFRSDGRIMVDTANFNKRNPNYGNNYGERENEQPFEMIEEDKLHITVPFIKGFSMPLKKWGEFAVSGMSEIKFNENAFETLVLEQDKKDIIKALVKNANAGFTDIIKGKSGGCIFLLHGPPGVGKTLTSEAIAETMKAPLYSVSVGELGINPSELEEKLRDILDMASTWKAQILIDEADIFLEKRNENDILRNAMVGVFLRLLEYHQGVLFLTTNRVRNIDEAFYSRISVALHYDALSKSNRRKIWDNLLACAGIKDADTSILCQSEINGRQIKTTIRLAQALARENNEKVEMRHILATIRLQEGFAKDLNNKKENDVK